MCAVVDARLTRLVRDAGRRDTNGVSQIEDVGLYRRTLIAEE